MQSCLCSKSFDLYSRKDKSNIICWETIIITFMINLTNNKVILLSQNILSGCDCETCCPGDLALYSTRGRFNVLTPTYLPDLIHLNNSIVVKWKYQLRSIQFGSWLLSVHIPVLYMKGPTVINCVASHILFVISGRKRLSTISKKIEKLGGYCRIWYCWPRSSPVIWIGPAITKSDRWI